MVQMIEAKEARAYAIKRVDEIKDTQLAEIKELILEECDKGKFYTCYNKYLTEEVERVLNDLGYNVERTGEEENLIEWEFIEDEAENGASEKSVIDDDEQADQQEVDQQEVETETLFEDNEEE